MLKRITLLFSLACTSGVAFAAGGGEGTFLGLPLIVFKVINFVILMGLLHKFARPAIANMLSSSAQATKEKVSTARSSVTEAEKQLAAYQIKVSNMEREIEARQEAALKAIAEEKQAIIQDAEDFTKNLAVKTNQRIEQDVLKAKGEIQAFLVSESIKLAEEMVTDSMSDKKQESLMEDYSKVLEKTA
ncbi:MAG: hypothetical protein COB67_06795 [SAR324 cluster bacterium]|uniref:ATP synthase subunit b n=1 Tax=SAR324 cluster bacterium TaxID=2024889 RepID=A0A2A4T4M0_9DELT|nr:MAG: hypothetical protein COB67_06795 [SAR324 cluster bacterium]